MRVRVGTSGFSYPQWKGSFYPEDLREKDMLGFYARTFPTVEINNTFYRLPKGEMLRTWHEIVPADFRFVIKASRRITHMARLKECSETVSYLYGKLDDLGDKLGAVLYQLPPNLKKDIARLQSFLDCLPPSAKAVFEFRNPTWFDPEVLDLLTRRGASLCIGDYEGAPPQELVQPSAPIGYVRLRREDYSASELQVWADKIRSLDWSEAFVFFMHEDEGEAPVLAERLQAMLG